MLVGDAACRVVDAEAGCRVAHHETKVAATGVAGRVRHLVRVRLRLRGGVRLQVRGRLGAGGVRGRGGWRQLDVRGSWRLGAGVELE